MCISLNICMHILCLSGAFGGQRMPLDPLELELQTIMSHLVGAGN